MRSTPGSKRATLAHNGGTNRGRSIKFQAALALSAALASAACGPQSEVDASPSALATTGQRLELGAGYGGEDDSPQHQPATDYTLFEADPVRPVAVLKKSGLVVVANAVDDTIELHQPDARGVQRCGAVKVGMRPVAVAAVRESRNTALLWVVNHISDSISIVELDTSSCHGAVVDTLYTGDEPRDIVVATTRSGKARVFVTAAHRGQHHPVASARLGTDLVTPPSAKAAPGLADVFVFDPDQPRAEPAVINLFTEVPRALALGDGVVYAAGFRTGNRTTVITAERVAQRGLASLTEMLSRDDAGNYVEQNGELRLRRVAQGRARIEGGIPAVAGHGRCMPDPRPERQQLATQQVCVATDREHRVQHVLLQREGETSETCRCTSGAGALQPNVSVIVKFFDTRAECGQDYHTFPDGSRGCWLDADPNGVDTPAARAADLEAPMAWNEEVRLSLPDDDVFAIDVDDLRVTGDYSGVGTVLFGMAVQPGTGRVFVTNTEAHNLTRFEGPGESSSTTVQGHLHESRVTVIDPRRNRVRPVHLNDHIDYGRCCDKRASENDNSFAFPTAGTFSEDGQTFYFSALGSDSIGIVDAAAIEPGFQNITARRDRRLRSIRIGQNDAPAGPVGLALDPERRRLYVKTHLSNELVVIDTQRSRILDRSSLSTPEPESIRAGREVFYDARRTSSHGDSACASCHVFGDFDGLSWDLGDPDGVTVNNPGPLVFPPELFALAQLAADPFAEAPEASPINPDFRSNKGPMNTQTLRGMANHGAMHWRGDRTRNFQDQTGRQPNFGSLDENNSFNEFDVAIRGLNGNDRSLEPEVFQAFTDFALQLTLPPNPVRQLDDSLTPEQARARASYFGCRSVSDAQLERRECIALDGALVDIDVETQRCRCASNPLIEQLRALPQAVATGNALKQVFSDAGTRAAFDRLAGSTRGLPAAAAAEARAAFQAFLSARSALLGASLALDARALLPLDPALALAASTGPILKLVALSRAAGTSTGQGLLDLLEEAAAACSAAGAFDAAGGVEAALTAAFALANLDVRAVVDESARGTGEFHNLFTGGCSLTEPEPVCRLRITDSFETCNGCHTLDRAGNAEFDVYRPGFFGTSGEYSFENESQIFKVPHLRNVYQKAGMFGVAQSNILLPESVLGPSRGGFFATENAFMGPQVRGYGVLHDGAIDTVDRFHGAAVFASRPPLTLGAGDPGNPNGFDPVLPEPSRRTACVQSFRQAPASALDGVEDPELRAALGLCFASGPVPEGCFLDPDSDSCQAALQAIGEDLGQSDFPATFAGSIRPACFQLGSMLEQGSPAGNCAPAGLRDRSEMESFMLAFDTNLAPMVGQQLTLRDSSFSDPLLAPLLRAAERRQCDLALRQNDHGYLVTRPSPSDPAQTQLTNRNGSRIALGTLRASRYPVTLTCYPPHPDRAEARRSAFGSVED